MEREQEGKSFSAQFAANYTTEIKRAERQAREERELAEETERERIRSIFAGTGINGTI